MKANPTLLADHFVHKGCVGCVAGDHRSSGMFGRREVRSIAANCDYVRAASSERLDHREPSPWLPPVMLAVPFIAPEN
jgi:hypothetical protein